MIWKLRNIFLFISKLFFGITFKKFIFLLLVHQWPESSHLIYGTALQTILRLNESLRKNKWMNDWLVDLGPRKNETKSLLYWEQDGGAPVRPSLPQQGGGGGGGANPVLSIFYSESFPVGIGQKGVDLKKLQPFC